MVDNYVIWVERVVDGVKYHQIYQGESAETEKRDDTGTGFSQQSTSLAIMNKLKFGAAWEDGHVISGFINLKSHLDRILRRAKSGDLGRVEEIHIKRVEGGNAK
jgi:hypothetical protein